MRTVLAAIGRVSQGSIGSILAIHPRRYFYETRRSAGKRSATSGFVDRLPKVMPKHIEILEDPLKAVGSTVYDAVKAYFTMVPGRVQAIEVAIKSNIWDSIPSAPVFDPTACDAEISVAENRLKEITSDSEAIEVMQGLAKTVGELQARKRLSENITLVTDHSKR